MFAVQDFRMAVLTKTTKGVIYQLDTYKTGSWKSDTFFGVSNDAL